MAQYLILENLNTGTRIDFVAIDEELCRDLGAVPDPEKWFKNWYNTVGFSLALGHNWDQVRTDWPEKLDIIDWLERHYRPVAWAAR